MTLINQPESVQRSFTKRLPQCQRLSYFERLNKLQLQSLEHRRLIFDLIMCYNIMSSNSCIDKDDCFQNEFEHFYAWSPFSYTGATRQA